MENLTIQYFFKHNTVVIQMYKMAEFSINNF